MFRLIFILYLTGILLLAMEIYIPGGIIGAIGLLALVLSIVLSFASLGAKAGFIMLFVVSVSVAVAFYLAIKYFPQSKLGKMLFLSKNIDDKVTREGEASSLVGKTGIAITDLRPSGTARIEGKRYDVMTQGDYISKGKEIEVVQDEGNRVVVRIAKP